MMMFRRIKLKLIDILETELPTGVYNVISNQKQSINAEKEIFKPRVQVSTSKNGYPRENSSFQTERESDLVFSIRVTVATRASLDLAVLEEPTSTPVQKAAALADMDLAVDRANDLLNDAVDNIYQVIEDARNYDLGFDEGLVRDRGIDDSEIYEAQRDGQLAVGVAILSFACKTTEEVSGEEGIAIGTNTGTTQPQGDESGVSGTED